MCLVTIDIENKISVYTRNKHSFRIYVHSNTLSQIYIRSWKITGNTTLQTVKFVIEI